ncbi:TPA: hypothetical protein ACJXKK_004310, partial [Salmonella enterica subsp. enterica serovar Rissen]
EKNYPELKLGYSRKSQPRRNGAGSKKIKLRRGPRIVLFNRNSQLTSEPSCNQLPVAELPRLFPAQQHRLHIPHQQVQLIPRLLRI